MAKSPAQLDAEIAASLSTSRATMVPTKKLGARQLDLLAQAASFSTLSVTDLVPAPRTIATLRPGRLKRMQRAAERLREMTDAGMLVEIFGDKYELTNAGRGALEAAGFVQQSTGIWNSPGTKRPGWAV